MPDTDAHLSGADLAIPSAGVGESCGLRGKFRAGAEFPALPHPLRVETRPAVAKNPPRESPHSWVTLGVAVALRVTGS